MIIYKHQYSNFYVTMCNQFISHWLWNWKYYTDTYTLLAVQCCIGLQILCKNSVIRNVKKVSWKLKYSFGVLLVIYQGPCNIRRKSYWRLLTWQKQNRQELEQCHSVGLYDAQQQQFIFVKRNKCYNLISLRHWYKAGLTFTTNGATTG